MSKTTSNAASITVTEEMPKTSDAAPTKKRKAKDLPKGLLKLNDINFRKVLKARLETDPNELEDEMVAYEVSLEKDNEPHERFMLDTLSLDQLRMLCRNVGVRYVNRYSKFECRKKLWVLAQHLEQREKEGAELSTLLDTTTSNIIRITNIIFHHEFLDSFLSLNDIKNRVDHEKGPLTKNFWEDVAEAVNRSGDDDDDIALQVVIEEEDERYEEIKAVDLQQFDVMTATAIRKKVFHLLKIRKEIQECMAKSGEHDSDPYSFVDIAIKNVGWSGLTKLGCYYFFLRCDDNPEVDVSFTDEMVDSLNRNTDTILVDSKETGPNEKKRAYLAIVGISKTAKKIAEEMIRTNTLLRESVNEMKEQNRLTKQSQLISLAQHLGKHEILEQMLASVASSSNE